MNKTSLVLAAALSTCATTAFANGITYANVNLGLGTVTDGSQDVDANEISGQIEVEFGQFILGGRLDKVKYSDGSQTNTHSFGTAYAGYEVMSGATVFAFYNSYDLTGFEINQKGLGGEYAFGNFTLGAAIAADEDDDQTKYIVAAYEPSDTLSVAAYAGWDDGDDDVDLGLLANAQFGKFDLAATYSTLEVSRGDYLISLEADYAISNKLRAGIEHTEIKDIFSATYLKAAYNVSGNIWAEAYAGKMDLNGVDLDTFGLNLTFETGTSKIKTINTREELLVKSGQYWSLFGGN